MAELCIKIDVCKVENSAYLIDKFFSRSFCLTNDDLKINSKKDTKKTGYR